MRRNLRSAAAEARKSALRRRKRARNDSACCYMCEQHLPGRLGKAAQYRPTARAAALRDQAENS